MPELADDIARILVQERRLRLAKAPPDLAWQLGLTLRERAVTLGQPVAIEVRRAGQTLFFHAMPGTAPENADWARRKRNLVELTHRSSYGIGLELRRDGATLDGKLGLPARDYASHGGAFPLAVEGLGVIGCVTVSGLPQRRDHALVVEVLAPLAGVPLAEVALDAG